MNEVKHLHRYETVYVFDTPDAARPLWAGSYNGPHRWLKVLLCECGRYEVMGFVYDKPDNVKVFKEVFNNG